MTLTLLLPYHPYDRPEAALKGFDGTFYPPGLETVPRRVAIVRANRYMVDHSGYLIAYAWHPASNARTLADYACARARKGNIVITRIFPSTDSMASEEQMDTCLVTAVD